MLAPDVADVMLDPATNDEPSTAAATHIDTAQHTSSHRTAHQTLTPLPAYKSIPIASCDHASFLYW